MNAANHNAARNHNDEADIRTRNKGASPGRGQRRMARYLNKRGRRADATFAIRNS